MDNEKLTVACPTCKKQVDWDMQNPYRPFCCERCRLIDLGEWAAERRSIPVENSSTENEFEDIDIYPPETPDN